jgi:nucleoside-diphosphate-sugar epimerase
MKDIIISGVTGFVGTNLKAYLKDQYRINGISRSPNEKLAIFGYSNTVNLLAKSTAFIHLAGKAHDLKKTSKDKEYLEINTDLTKTLFDQFLKSNCKVFIYMSSVKAVADSLNEILHENAIPNPQTIYGISKSRAEEYIQNQVLPDGKSYYILRPCMIHGPGNKGNLNLLYKLIFKGIPYPLAAFENKRSYLSIENLCFVIRELLNRDDIPSGVYNVADDVALSTNELIRLIAEASNKKPLLWKISPSLIRSLAILGNFLKLPLTTERLNKLTENYIVDNSKIKNAIGKEFPVLAQEGIIKTIKSFKNVS